MSEIIQLYSDKDKTIKAYPKTLASEVYMDDGVTNVSTEVDNKIKEVNSQLDNIKSNHLTVSVKDFGAKGDGITDDTQAIQNAINYVKSRADYGVILFPYTRLGYRVTKKIANLRGLHLKGEGTKRESYLATGNGTGIFTKSYFLLDEVKDDCSFENNIGTVFENLGFMYKTVNPVATSGTIPTFPWTIKGFCHSATIKNVSVFGASHFADYEMLDRNTIDGVYGVVTKQAFRFRKATDLFNVSNIALNTAVTSAGERDELRYWVSDYFKNYINDNLDVFVMGRSDGGFFSNINTMYANRLFYVVPFDYVDSYDNVPFIDNANWSVSGNNILADYTRTPFDINRRVGDNAFSTQFANIILFPMGKNGEVKTGCGIKINSGCDKGSMMFSNLEIYANTKVDKFVIANPTGETNLTLNNVRLYGLGTLNSRSDYAELFSLNDKINFYAFINGAKQDSLNKNKMIVYSNRSIEYNGAGLVFGNISINEQGINLNNARIGIKNNQFDISKLNPDGSTNKTLLTYDTVNDVVKFDSSDNTTLSVAKSTRTEGFISVGVNTSVSGKAKCLGNNGGYLLVRSNKTGDCNLFLYSAGKPLKEVSSVLGTGFITSGTATGDKILITSDSTGNITFTSASDSSGTNNIYYEAFALNGMY